MNEYLADFETLQEKNTFKGQQWFGERQQLVEKYSWAVPNDDALTYLAEFDHIYEVGAGTGYWARCIEAHGGDVTAIERDPPDETWTDVVDEDFWDYEEMVRDEPVLLVWPPNADPLAADVLYSWPSHILYVGEQKGGCTADDEFFDALEETYGLVAKIELPSYTGIHDNFYHYVRKV